MDGNDTSDLQPKSELALRAVAMPVFANAHGDIFGGWLLSQMDLAGGSVATRLAKGRVVTVAVTAMTFSLPGLRRRRGELLCVGSQGWRTSITVKIESFAPRGRTGERIAVTEGLFTYVAVDSQSKPRPVLHSSI
jgi:acyl-CoA thioesterase YciA